MSEKFRFSAGIVVLLLFICSLAMDCHLVDGKSSVGSAGIIAFLLGSLYFGVVGSV